MVDFSTSQYVLLQVIFEIGSMTTTTSITTSLLKAYNINNKINN